MLIRKATEKDSEACMKLYRLDSEKYWEISDIRSSAEHADVIFLVAEENSRIVGYVLGFVNPTKREEGRERERNWNKAGRCFLQRGICRSNSIETHATSKKCTSG